MGRIPAGSTLVFETELRGIKGVEAGPSPTEDATMATETAVEEGAVGIQTAAPEPEPEKQDANGDEKPPPDQAPQPNGGENEECKLLGPFSLLVQGALGLLALLSLVYKRWREKPRRPVKVWFFDVSKQVFGAMLLHILNLLMSMLSSGKFDAAKAAPAYVAPGPDGGEELQQPNGCSFYLLNLAIDVQSSFRSKKSTTANIHVDNGRHPHPSLLPAHPPLPLQAHAPRQPPAIPKFRQLRPTPQNPLVAQAIPDLRHRPRAHEVLRLRTVPALPVARMGRGLGAKMDGGR